MRENHPRETTYQDKEKLEKLQKQYKTLKALVDVYASMADDRYIEKKKELDNLHYQLLAEQNFFNGNNTPEVVRERIIPKNR